MKRFKSVIKNLLFPLFAALIITGINGCGDNTVTPQTDNVDFSSMSTGDTIGDNIGILVLDTVKVLLKDIKLNVANNTHDSTNFKVGPYVLYLNMSSSVNVMSTAYIPAGTYDKVAFKIHKLEDNEAIPDPDFFDANGRYSVVVKGRYSGVEFVFKSSKSAHQKLSFQGNLVVSISGKSNITLQIKPYIWFIKNGLYLDPTVPGNQNDIDNNIKDNINNNFKIFVDNDRNGIPD
jgi:hypothetical protein